MIKNILLDLIVILFLETFQDPKKGKVEAPIIALMCFGCTTHILTHLKNTEDHIYPLD